MDDEQQVTRTGSRAAGYLFAIIHALFYSTLSTFGKLLYATGLNAQDLVILRFLCTTVLLGGFMLIWRKHPLVSKQPAVYAQAALFFVTAVLYFMTAERLSAGMTTVIFYTFPLVVALINTVFFREKFTIITGAALVLAIGGLVLVSGAGAGELVLDPIGIALGIASCVAFAIYSVLIQKTGRTESPFTVTLTISWVSLIASCVFLAPSVPTMFHLSAYQLGIGCVIALLNTILPVTLYIESIKRIGATESSLVSISETPFSLMVAFILLGETLTAQQGVGTILIMAGIIVITAAPLLNKDRTAKQDGA